MANTEITKLLRNVAAAYVIKNESKYRFQIIAYQRASDTVAAANTEVKELLKEGRLDVLPGIGPSMKQYLEELANTGQVKHFKHVMKGIPEAVFPLLDVPSFGPKRAFKLVSHFQLKNEETVIDDIEKLAKQGKIAALPGFGEKSQEDIMRAIDEFKLGKGKTTRMVLPFAFELAERMLRYLRESKAVIDARPLGSLRRTVSTIGDIDIAIATSNPNAVITHFVAYPYKERVIEEGDTTASILVSGGRQIDLMTMPPESFGSLLQHFTGSKNHNVHLREYALSKGLSLSEYGIKRLRGGKIEKFDTEEKFYKALGMDWIPPEIREDAGEIEAATTHSLPTLVTLEDIKGDVHIHSSYPIEPSHDLGNNDMQTMIDKAVSLGYEYIGFSEHNPSISKHSKNQIYTILSKRKDKIEQLKSSNKNIRVINLLEVDILTNADLAIDDKALSTLDAAIVSVHSTFSLDRKAMTKRVLNALSHPKAKILCHPTGRLINKRPGYELDFDAVFSFCREHDKALEINGWSTRLDLSDIIVREAVRGEVMMVANTDSHAVTHMNNMRYAVSVARRGWAEKRNILNTLPHEEFMRWLKNS